MRAVKYIELEAAYTENEAYQLILLSKIWHLG